jgi:hypothetical protein
MVAQEVAGILADQVVDTANQILWAAVAVAVVLSIRLIYYLGN